MFKKNFLKNNRLNKAVGRGLPQLMLNKASTQYRRLGFTPANEASIKSWDKSQPTKNSSIQSIIGIMLFGTLLASTSHAQTCKNSITKTAPDSRYEVLAGGSEVKDSQTGLIWQRCSLGQTWDSGSSTCTGTATAHNWSQALSQAQALGNGYRLPNIKELQSLVEEACYSPAINESIFPNSQSGVYWSASPHAGNSSNAWGVYFRHGHTYGSYKRHSHYVRAVRESR